MFNTGCVSTEQTQYNLVNEINISLKSKFIIFLVRKMNPKFLNTLVTYFLCLLPFYQKFSDNLCIYPSPQISSWYYSPLYQQNMMFISSILKNLANKNKKHAQKYIFYLLIKVKFLNNINTVFLKWVLYIIIVFSVLHIKCLILSFKDMSLLSAGIFWGF